MKFSKKTRYGLRALVDLAVNSKSGHVSLTSIAQRNEISQQYLEQIFSGLKRAGIVKSIKGNQGGYYLGKASEEITLSSIVRALEGEFSLEAEELPSDAWARKISRVIQSQVIDRINEQTELLLDDITLKDLEEEYMAEQYFEQDMYYI